MDDTVQQKIMPLLWKKKRNYQLETGFPYVRKACRICRYEDAMYSFKVLLE